MFRGFTSIVYKESIHILRDPKTLFLMLLIPGEPGSEPAELAEWADTPTAFRIETGGMAGWRDGGIAG